MRKKKQVVVIGLGHFGSSVARTLSELGHEVLGIDRNPDAVSVAADFVTQAVQADASSEGALREMGVRNFDIGVVSIA
ncbi:MAG TPA: NAD-binding protein, partial [Chloroflexota bacterium]|nr:NAD-binding protein [Chloroflexota bacterium]